MISLPEDAVLHDAVRTAGFDGQDARRLWQHATTVYLLPKERIIVRVTEGSQAAESAVRAVDVTRWLRSHGLSVVEPVDIDQPLRLGVFTVTFWHYYPQDHQLKPEPEQLGRLLRRLHDLPTPPFELPQYEPLSSFGSTVSTSTSLPAEDQQWLLDERGRLLDDYHRLDFPLGVGHIHGDAYPGNVMWDGDIAILGDWDETAVGPRELDLANTYQGIRFGRTAGQLAGFAQEYGYDIETWSGLPTLRAMRDLHTLGSFIRRADQNDEAAAAELEYRLSTLRSGDAAARWNAR
jgi:hypothetical protein